MIVYVSDKEIQEWTFHIQDYNEVLTKLSVNNNNKCFAIDGIPDYVLNVIFNFREFFCF